MSRQKLVCFLKSGGIEELKENRRKNLGFSHLLAPNLYLSFLLAVCSMAIAIAPTTTAFATHQTEMAQTPRGPNPSQKNTLYVSASRGRDSGDGTQNAPLRTITQALKFAGSNTVILLAPGTYSAATGEVFPLILKPEVTIQGNPFDRGKSVIISGGGDYISPTFARQNITMLAAEGSVLTGVTITNSNYKGYGLWVESSSPVVVKNTLTGNTHDGISVVGNGAPIVRENDFLENGANGITVYGNSQAEIRDNLFQNNGFGINVAQEAAPGVVGNRIIYNQDGILIQDNARPAIRGNYIEENKRDGIIAIARSFPDLGNSSEPGRNTIRNNGRYDLHNATNENVIPAYGNLFDRDRLSGSFDLAGTAPPQLDENPEAIREERVLDRILPNRDRGLARDSTEEAIEIPVPKPQDENPRGNRSWEERLLERIRENRDRDRPQLEIPARPSPPLRGLRTRTTIPTSETQAPTGLLPVPGPNIPLGSGGYVPPELRGVANAGDYAVALGLRYRVVVSVRGRRDTSRLLAIVPDAFYKNIDGESVMQAGAFRDRGEAEELSVLLKRNGLNARIVPFN